jgi:hypothetical protein
MDISLLAAPSARPFIGALALLALLPAMTACSVRQVHDAGQASQMHECGRVIDVEDYRRCMARANVSYDEFLRREAERKARH